MEELRRRMSSAKAWGIESELVSPGVRRREGAVPRPRPDHRRVLDPVGRRGRLAARRHDHAREGAGVRCPDRRTHRRGDRPRRRGAGRARIRRVRTTGGDIEAEHVVIACGVWSPKIGDMAGISDPADPGGAPDDQRRARARSSPAPRARSPSRSSGTWTPSATSASTAPTWRSAPTRTARSCTSPRRSPRSSRPSCRRPRCRSPPTTSTPSSSRPTS